MDKEEARQLFSSIEDYLRPVYEGKTSQTARLFTACAEQDVDTLWKMLMETRKHLIELMNELERYNDTVKRRHWYLYEYRKWYDLMTQNA